MNKPFNIIISGGKTGGHLFPGIATAQALERIHGNIRILFVGTSAPFETRTLEQYGYAHKTIFSRPVKGGSIPGKLFSMAVILISLIQSMVIILRFKPDFVLGVGGFSSFAPILSAWILRIPRAIQEQNAIPGLTNRVLSRFVQTIFTSFKNTRGMEENPKVRHTGNPVRRTDPGKTGTRESGAVESGSVGATAYPTGLENTDPEKLTLLITGGSQGAGSINNAFVAAIALMEDPHQFNIFHQTGIQDEPVIQKKYKEMKIDVTARAFFRNMPELQEIADIVITRAGAGILSELSLRGLAAILVPYPHAADDHQTYNAKALEDSGAAVMIADKDLTGEILRQTLEGLIRDRERLHNMARSIKQLAMPNADETIARLILKSGDIKDPGVT